MSGSDRTAAIVGVGHSAVHRYDDVALGSLAVEACQRALADAGLGPADIDGIAAVPAAPFNSERLAFDGTNFVTANLVIRALGLRPSWGENVHGVVSNALVEAINAVQSGSCDTALVFRALPSPRGSYGHTSEKLAHGPAQFELPYGSFYPVTWAQMWHRYQAKYGSGSREQMATLVLQERANGLLWEHGYWSQHNPAPLSLEEYLSGRVVSSPLSIYDCDIPVHGCGAFVVTTTERARDRPHRQAYVRGLSAPLFASSAAVQPITLEGELDKGRMVARSLWERSGFTPDEMDLANVYDGFSIIAMIWLEALGFCGEGEAFDFIQGGRIALDGKLPLNTSGGNLGAGRMHGVPHLMDSILQVTGRSGPRQVTNANYALAAVGPQTHGPAIIFASH